MNDTLSGKCLEYIDFFCNKIEERSVGTSGNREATAYFQKEVSDLGWKTESDRFEAIDWRENGVVLRSDDLHFEAYASPYSNGFSGDGRLVTASSVGELENIDMSGAIILLHGDIAREQLMPKNFVFYNPDEHQRIIAILEKAKPEAIICATGRNPELAGGVYPFPMIEDGDFDIPSVYMTQEEGARLIKTAGKRVSLFSRSERIPGYGYNVIASMGHINSRRIIVTAHVDSKKGTPGAIDNATGVTLLLLLARQLQNYDGKRNIELVALNGEDYYSVPGQMNYITKNHGRFDEMLININIDGAGYIDGPSAFSLFNLPEQLRQTALLVMKEYNGITEGELWPQGDHSIFLQNGVPAIAVSSKWFIDNIAVQDITHTPRDNPSIVDCNKLIEISSALNQLIRGL